jgi:DNA-binding transcriptional MerR regulator
MASSGALTPSKLASLTGVSTDTLRHYEKKGLLALPPRTDAGHRRYPPGAADRVRLIQRALVIGFSLEDLARVLRERDRGGAPCRTVRALVGARRVELDRQIADLMALRSELDGLLAQWDKRLAATAPGKQARLLELFTTKVTKPTKTLGAGQKRPSPS